MRVSCPALVLLQRATPVVPTAFPIPPQPVVLIRIFDVWITAVHAFVPLVCDVLDPLLPVIPVRDLLN